MQDNELFLARGREYIARSPDVSKTVQDLVRLAAEAVGSRMGALYLLDETESVLKPFVVVNLPDEYVKGVGDVRLGTQCCGRAALHQLPWYVDDIWNEPLFPPETKAMARRSEVRAGFSVPVIVTGDRCIGALSAHFPEPHVPSGFEIHRQNLFAQLIAMALLPGAYAVEKMPSTSARPISEDKPQQSFTAD